MERAIALRGQTPRPQSKIRAKPQRSCLGKGEAPSYRQPLQGALAEGVKGADQKELTPWLLILKNER